MLLFRGEVKDNVVLHRDVSGKQTAKGTKTSVKNAFLRHHHYKDVLINLSTVRVHQNAFQSRYHAIGTCHQNKVALTAFDTKRWIENDGVNTLAYGHCDTLGENSIDWDEDIDVFL